ncbi:uncharacterized protein LOC100337636 [Tribolium castaneum]|uniref:uncharacterized protein LOC100337636 n=1 Tax=Tribolium castaneum TaxID=7070 RepID=UPI0030FE383A
MRRYQILLIVIFFNILFDSTLSENYVLKAAKNVPRIGRSNTNKNTNIDEMGKFFMKASKSVPRIGRRNENFDYGQPIVKRDEVPIWSDIADRFEYDPEILTSPEILEQLEMRDDPSVYEWEKIRTKRDSHKPHPKFYYVM